MNVTTKVFSLSTSVYASRYAERTIGRLWWLALLPLLFFCLMGYMNGPVWYYLIPIFIFLVYPMFIFWGYLLSVAHKEAVMSVKPHRLEITSNGIFFKEYSLRENHAFTEKGSKVRLYPETDIEVRENSNDFFIPDSEITDKFIEGKYSIFRLSGAKGRMLIVPLEAFEPKDIEKVQKYMTF